MKLAYLAPEIPSVSCTFVFRELLAIERETRVPVVPFSLRAVASGSIAADGEALRARTRTVYGDRKTLLRNAVRFAARHPVRALRTLVLSARDVVRGEARRRWTIPLQALAGLSLAAQLQDLGIEHLHVHFANAPASVGMYAALAAGIPFSVTAHANDIYVDRPLLAEKLARASRFVTISNRNRAFLEGLAQRAASVDVIRCGVDTSKFVPRTPGRASGDPVVFTVGRLVSKKGIDVLIESLRHVKAPVRLVVAGDGPLGTELQSLAEDRGVGDRVTFLGAVSTEEIQRRLAHAAAFVLPCRRAPDGDLDGIPVALMEAMASGVPCISTRISGIPELIRHGENGLLVEPEDSEALAAALDRVLEGAELAQRLARQARDTVRTEYDLRGNARRLSRVFQNEAVALSGSAPERDAGLPAATGATRGQVYALGTPPASRRA